MDSSHLPFKVGQQAEAKSFQKGYRGAWFRCKIQEMCRRKGQIRCALDYFDYPDDKTKWMVLYQRPRLGRAKQQKMLKAQLMLRPSFPQLFHEEDASSILADASEDIVIVRDHWKVGDLVDWFSDGCYWSGRVIQFLEGGKVKVELPQPPEGEGFSYDVAAEDLRPSLHWTPQLGWTVPFPKGRGTSCVRVVRSSKGGEPKAGFDFLDKIDTLSGCGAESSISYNRSDDSLSHPEDASLLGKEEKEKDSWLEDDQADTNSASTAPNSSNTCPGFLLPLTRSLNPRQASSMQKMEYNGRIVEAEVCSCPVVTPAGNLPAAVNGNFREISGTGGGVRVDGGVSYSHGPVDLSREVKGNKDDEVSPKMTRICRSGDLTSAIHVDSIDSSLMDLEELANKIRWLKRLLRCGTNWPNATKPSWKFHEEG